MPLFILVVAVILIAAGINNKLSELTALLKSDFTSDSGAVPFQIWIVAIFVTGSLGYIRELKPVANAFLVLVVLGLILAQQGKNGSGGFFEKFMQAMKGK